MECILQRSMSYRTKDVRTAYEWLKICVLDPHVKKVVVIAHSQGGIIASLVLNRMLAELPHDAISKLVGRPRLRPTHGNTLSLRRR